MTAQVLLMNRLAVALASDSVVSSVNNDNVVLTRATSEKILPLAGDHTIAAMTYGQADLGGYPIEVLLWEWSSGLTTRLAGVPDYLQSFTTWLGRLPELATDEKQRGMYRSAIKSFAHSAWRATNPWAVDLSPNAEEDSTSAEDLEAYRDKMKVWSDWIRNKPILDNLDDRWLSELTSKFPEVAAEIFDFYFDDRPASEVVRRDFIKALQRVPAVQGTDDTTGVVFAGFGASDLLPRVAHSRISDVLNSRTRHSKPEGAEGRSGYYEFFGQWNAAVQFIRGIDSQLQNATVREVERLVESALGGALPDGSSIEVSVDPALSGEVAGKISQAVDRFLDSSSDENFINPLMDVIGLSPEADLGRMAKSLIEIQAIRQSIDESTPTVGGPIDVAVISKVNGFRWVQHKSLD